MKALSIIGIIMSIGGLLTSLFVMTEAKANCYCNEDYLYSSGSVPDEAISGSLISMVIFVFFLVFSIVNTAKSFGKNNNALTQSIPPFQANPFQNFQQPYGQQFQQQFPPNPYQQNPYQNPQQNPTPPSTPPTNPWEPPRQ
ncbi:MAG: hypothetical protein NT084_07910 [Bacteroidetes bacterium]|nr:hypothetical protein [Bacteroidota bacterium]